MADTPSESTVTWGEPPEHSRVWAVVRTPWLSTPGFYVGDMYFPPHVLPGRVIIHRPSAELPPPPLIVHSQTPPPTGMSFEPPAASSTLQDEPSESTYMDTVIQAWLAEEEDESIPVHTSGSESR